MRQSPRGLEVTERARATTWGFVFAPAYVLITALYAVVGFTSPGFDDEFFTIRWIENYGSESIGQAQRLDVNPPGSYAIYWLLYAGLGDWSLVRLVVSLLAAASVVYAIARVRGSHGEHRGLIAIFVVGLSPALLMWTTSLRWYALFVPLLLVLSFPPRRVDWRYWATYFGGLAILGYLSYAMFIIALPLGYLYWRGDPRPHAAKLRQMVAFGLLFGFVYAYQMWMFLTEDLARDASQRFPLIEGVIGFAVAGLSNQGVFPLSVGGAASAIGTLGVLAIIGLTSLRANVVRNPLFVPYWLGVFLLIVSGLAGKFRNFVVLAPWQGLYVAQAIVPKKWVRAFVVAVVLIGAGNSIGVANVVLHSNTSKSSWNLPVEEVIAAVDEANVECNSDIVVVAHDPTLTYVLEARGYPVVGPWSRKTDMTTATDRVPECVVALKTYTGSLELAAERLNAAVAAINADARSTQLFGYDPAYALKRRIEPDYPEYQVEVQTLRQPTDVRPLQELVTQQRR